MTIYERENGSIEVNFGDDEMYTIEEVVYDDCDPALDGSTEYFVYLK